MSWRHGHSFLAGAIGGACAVMDWRLLVAGAVGVFCAGWYGQRLSRLVRRLAESAIAKGVK